MSDKDRALGLESTQVEKMLERFEPREQLGRVEERLEPREQAGWSQRNVGNVVEHDVSAIAEIFAGGWNVLTGDELKVDTTSVDDIPFRKPVTEAAEWAYLLLRPLIGHTARAIEPTPKVGRRPRSTESGQGSARGDMTADWGPRSGLDREPGAASGALPGARRGPTRDELLKELGLSEPLEQFSVEDGASALSAAVRQNMDSPGRVAALLSDVAGPFFEQHREIADKEALVDSVIRLLIPVARRRELAQGIHEVVPRLRCVIPVDQFTPLQKGMLMTLTALPTLTSVAGDAGMTGRKSEWEARSVIYYHEVLRQLLLWPDARRKEDQGAYADILEQATNNIAASLGRLRRDARKDAGTDDKHAVRLINDLARISRSISKSDKVRFPKEVAEITKIVGMPERLGQGAGPDDWFPRLSSSEMVSIDGEDEEHPLLRAWRRAVTGLLRAANRQGERASSGMFNAGVTLLRDEQTRLPAVRTLVNAAGVVIAFDLARSAMQAMGEYDGGQCMVNLLGAINGWFDTDPDDVPRTQAMDLVRAAKASLAGGYYSPADGARIAASVDSIREALPKDQGGNASPALSPEAAALSWLRVLGQRSGVAIGPEARLEEIAALTRKAFADAAKALHDDIVTRHPELAGADDVLNTSLSASLNELMADMREPHVQLAQVYRKNKYATDATVEEAGPLVAAGLFDSDQWNKAVEKALGIKHDPRLTVAFEEGFGGLAQRLPQPQDPPPTSGYRSSDDTGGSPRTPACGDATRTGWRKRSAPYSRGHPRVSEPACRNRSR